ncbi:MAG: family 16 glycosylhydrolase [Planctomycetota bacterium]
MTKRVMFALLSVITASAAHGQGLPESARLVWSDEFDGNGLNRDNWTPMIGDGTQFGIPGWGNNELQYYRDDPANVSVSNGTLKITARRQAFENKDYTSARLRTLEKVDFKYGWIEGRIKLPSTTGIWPAFWMLASNSPYGNWPFSGEIDIMESVNFADRIYGTIHYGGPNSVQTGGQFADGTDFSQDFHVYAAEWDQNWIRFYIDGQLYRSINRTTWFSGAAPMSFRAPFDQQFHLLLNVAVGGNFPGNPNGSSVFPQTMEVDYVRIYSLDPVPFNGSPASIPGTIEVEDYDIGYPNEAFFDVDVENRGGAYRPQDDVDIEPTVGGGFNVGWIGFAEFMRYSVDVEQAGNYRVTARVASQSTGGRFELEFGGESVGMVDVPATGGFQSWQEVETTVTLAAGEQPMRFINNSGFFEEYNVDRLRFEFLGADCPADVNSDGSVNDSDFFAWVTAFTQQSAACDVNLDGSCSDSDFFAWVTVFTSGGC